MGATETQLYMFIKHIEATILSVSLTLNTNNALDYMLSVWMVALDDKWQFLFYHQTVSAEPVAPGAEWRSENLVPVHPAQGYDVPLYETEAASIQTRFN